MPCCRSDWTGLCLFCCDSRVLLTASRVDLGFFVSNFTPPPQEHGLTTEGAQSSFFTASSEHIASPLSVGALVVFQMSISLSPPPPFFFIPEILSSFFMIIYFIYFGNTSIEMLYRIYPSKQRVIIIASASLRPKKTEFLGKSLINIDILKVFFGS